MSLLLGPFDTIVTGTPISFSINSIYFLQFFRKLAVLLDSTNITIPSRKHFQDWFCICKLCRNRKFLLYFSVNFISRTYRNLFQVIKAVYSSKDNICSALDLAAITACNRIKPSIRRGRPVVAPYSPLSPPCFRSSSASFSSKISLTNSPAPTATGISFLLPSQSFLISYGGIPAPIAPYAANVEEEVTIG